MSEVVDYCQNTFDLKRIGLSYRQYLTLRFGKKLVEAAMSLGDKRIHKRLEKFKPEFYKIQCVVRSVQSTKNGNALDFTSYTNLKRDFKYLKKQDTVRLIMNELLKGIG